MTETYFYGQGKVYSRVSGGKWRWWGDVSALTLAAEIQKAEHIESYSGQKGLARSFPIGKTVTLNATLHQIDTAAIAEGLYGAVSDIAAGSVTNESLGTVAAGDIVKLAFGAVSSVVITDSLGSPATIAGSHYDLDARFGSIEFLTLPSGPAPTQPLKAAYSHLAGTQANFLTQPAKTVEFRYEGVNLAEENAPVIVELYKVSSDPFQELALITDGNDVAGLPLASAVLIDTSKSASGALGQFGRFVQFATE